MAGLIATNKWVGLISIKEKSNTSGESVRAVLTGFNGLDIIDDVEACALSLQTLTTLSGMNFIDIKD